MNIGIVCYPSYGGSGVVATELSLALAQRRHQVHLIAYEPPVRYINSRWPVTLHVVDIPQYPLFKYPPYLLALTNKIAEVARYHRLDVLHVHYAIPHATAGFLARQMLGRHLPLITTLHGTDITLLGDDPSFYDVIEFSMNQSDALTAVSHALARATKEKFRLRVPIETIHNFVNPAVYHPDAGAGYRRSEIAGNRRIVIHVSNFRSVKRVPLVVEIFARAIRNQVDAELWLVGDGPDSGEARRQAVHWGVADRVRFLGKQERPEQWIACADVLLLPSVQESFGLAALEALACGVPVVASRVGGLVEVVVDGESGFLHEPDDIEGMAGSVRLLLSNPDLKRCMGLAGRRRAIEKFSSERIIPMYEDLYYRVVYGGKPARQHDSDHGNR